MMESTTEAIFQKFLNKGKFSQAEELALKYNKDTDIVRKAKVQSDYNNFLMGFNKNLPKKGFLSV